MALSAADIRHAFDVLGNELASRQESAELVVAGGAALVLLFGARETTKDVDAYFLRPAAALVRSAAMQVASALDLPDDWLNDAAKGYFVGVTRGELLYDSPSLQVRAASVAQLLAMKLGAWRDAVDRADARLLLSKLSGDKDSIWATIVPLIPPATLQKASYAFEDLWEAAHGTQ